jgi:hypothetical protein
LIVRSDSVGTLTLLLKLKASGRGPNIVAREIALDLGTASFKPAIFLHVPGLANKASDILSRMHQPGKHASLPFYLTRASRTPVPIRLRSWYRSLR